MSAWSLQQLFNLQQKTVFITGASSGIGEHCAKLFGSMGCKVALAARTKHKIDVVAAQLAEQHIEAFAVAMDVDNRSSVEPAVTAVVNRFGAIDILINNAGIARTARFLEMTEQDWGQVIDTNLGGVWRVGQCVARQMVGQKNAGSIINIASILGTVVQKQQTNYSSAKSAVIQLTKSMALELRTQGEILGVRVNAIAPGYMITGINRDFFASARGRQYLANLFPGRAGRLEELDGALLLLAGDAGSYINGSVITVDGGTVLAGV